MRGTDAAPHDAAGSSASPPAVETRSDDPVGHGAPSPPSGRAARRPRSGRRARGVLLLVAAVLLVVWGWFVLGFLEEPSAVDNVRLALIVIGGGSVALGVAAAAAAAWMLAGRRT